MGIDVLNELKKIGFMFPQCPRFHIKKREEGIIKGLSLIKIIAAFSILGMGEKSFPFVLIRIESVVSVRENKDHLLNGPKGMVGIFSGMKVMGNNRLGNLFRPVISFPQTAMF
jgi:hypothetical protein